MQLCILFILQILFMLASCNEHQNAQSEKKSFYHEEVLLSIGNTVSELSDDILIIYQDKKIFTGLAHMNQVHINSMGTHSRNSNLNR